VRFQAQALRTRLHTALDLLGSPGAHVRYPRPGTFPTEGARGHFHLRPELFFQWEGRSRFRFPGEELDLGPGEILVVPPLLLHDETAVTEQGKFENLVLYSDEASVSVHLADRGGGDRPQILYPESVEGAICGRVASWLGDAVRMAADLDEGATLTVDLVRSALRLTLKLLERPGPQVGEDSLLLVRCRRMVHEDLGDPNLSVASLARRLGCGADYLSHLFKGIRGVSLTSYILGLRLDRAAELLTETDLSGKEVAWACGFASQGYFIRCFRQRWGVTPGVWWSQGGRGALPGPRFGPQDGPRSVLP
jgi:AraC-like DNA-binding protein/mannose-6-phosphate isomerase-like protein (cupin superfamily)